MLKLILHGCNGKMGQVLAQTIKDRPDMDIVAGVDRSPNKYNNSFAVYDDIFKVKNTADVIIDFSNPYYLPGLLDYGVETNTALVLATTGFSNNDLKDIYDASEKIPIFYSANMSLGINILIQLIKKAALSLDSNWDIEIIEKHHNQKVDAPSGTAYMLANSINDALKGSKEYVFGRYTKKDKRTSKEIGIHAVRGGSIVGEHTVLFAGEDEVLELSHRAASKKIFANGALNCAKFIADKKHGFFNMDDLLNDL